MSKIYIGADHNGYELKQKVTEYFDQKGYDYEDLGATTFDTTDDYPDYAINVAEQTIMNNGKGILICKNGVGVCITSNKIEGVRAVRASHEDVAITSRNDDDTNILCIGSKYVDFEKAKTIIEVWLNTPFAGEERFIRRINKIKSLEKDGKQKEK